MGYLLKIERDRNKHTLSLWDIPTSCHQRSWSHLIIDQSYSGTNSYSNKIKGYRTKCNGIYFQQLEYLICRPDHGVPLIYLRISFITIYCFQLFFTFIKFLFYILGITTTLQGSCIVVSSIHGAAHIFKIQAGSQP